MEEEGGEGGREGEERERVKRRKGRYIRVRADVHTKGLVLR